jgi:predicted PurR-regulated permease PerM
MLPAARGASLRLGLNDLQWKMRWWLIGVLISMGIIGALSWVGYWLVGLQFALPLAIFAGLAEIVPNIGALTAFGVALVVGATQGTGVLVGVIVVHSITLTIEAHFIMPVVMRGAVNLPPLVTIFTVVLWSEVLGFGGLLMAVPLDLLIWTMAEHFLLRPARPDKPPAAQSRAAAAPPSSEEPPPPLLKHDETEQPLA